MNDKAKIGIVTVLYNGEKVLPDFFESLEAQSFRDFILYAVDNASSDSSVAKCEEYASKVRFPVKVLAQKENFGVAKGNNIGIRAALADGCTHIILANNDVIFPSDTIKNLLEGLQAQKADMAVPKIYFHDSGRIWCAGGAFSPWRGITRHFGFNCPDDGQFDGSKKITYSPTCFMLIDAKVFEDVGLMDEKYFVYYDDSDFVWRAVMEHGKQLYYIPTATLRHKVSSSTGGGTSDFSVYYISRNNLYFILKNIHGVKGIMARIYRKLAFMKKSRSLTPKQREIACKARKEALDMLK